MRYHRYSLFWNKVSLIWSVNWECISSYLKIHIYSIIRVCNLQVSNLATEVPRQGWWLLSCCTVTFDRILVRITEITLLKAFLTVGWKSRCMYLGKGAWGKRIGKGHNTAKYALRLKVMWDWCDHVSWLRYFVQKFPNSCQIWIP